VISIWKIWAVPERGSERRSGERRDKTFREKRSFSRGMHFNTLYCPKQFIVNLKYYILCFMPDYCVIIDMINECKESRTSENSEELTESGESKRRRSGNEI
jgi:hypothetical protein